MNARLGLSLRKPPGWHFVSVADFEKLMDKQQLELDDDAPLLSRLRELSGAPILTVNRPQQFKFGTVGKALDGVTLRIAEDGVTRCRFAARRDANEGTRSSTSWSRSPASTTKVPSAKSPRNTVTSPGRAGTLNAPRWQ